IRRFRSRRRCSERGVAFLVGRALDRIGLQSNGATAIVQGFGNVGSVSAYTLAQRGVKIMTSATTPPLTTAHARLRQTRQRRAPDGGDVDRGLDRGGGEADARAVPVS